MAKYFVDFTGYIDEVKRPENFPREIHVKDVLDNVEDIQHLQFLVNNKFTSLVLGAGLVVFKNEDAVHSTGITFDKRWFVPWHMITHFGVEVKHIPEPVRPQDSIAPGESESEKKPNKEWTN